MKSWLTVLGLTLASCASFGQIPWQLVAQPPAAVSSVSTTLVGNPGNATFCYWVIAIYPVGKAFPTGPACVTNAPSVLTGSNYVSVTWNAAAGATGYDVIRMPSGAFPAGGSCASCSVATAQTGITLNDQGAALGAYTLAIAGNALANLYLNNRDYAAPIIVADTPLRLPSLSFPDGTTQTSAGGGSISQLSDCKITRTSATVLTIAAAATAANPCQVRMGGVVYTFTSPSTVTLSGVLVPTTVRVYVSDTSDGAPAGTLKVGNSQASGIVCSGCTVENVRTSFPGNSFQIGTWTASVATTWDATATDLRAAFGMEKRLVAGTNVTIVETPTTRTLNALAAVDHWVPAGIQYGAGTPTDYPVWGTVGGTPTVAHSATIPGPMYFNLSSVLNQPVYYSFVAPASYSALTITAQVFANDTTAGNFKLQADVQCVASGAALPGPGGAGVYGNAQSTQTVNNTGTASALQQIAIPAIAACSAGNLVNVRLMRIGASSSEYGSSIWFVGANLNY